MRAKNVKFHLLFVLLVGAFVLLNNSNQKQGKTNQPYSVKDQASASRETAMVSRVVDGDTIKVLINSKEDTVRLIGIDSPEVVDQEKPVQCFGREASDKAKEILGGKAIILESDSSQKNRDEYGRLLRYVFVDNSNFNQFMVSEGFAREYAFKGKPYRYRSDFIESEKKAKAENKGLWKSCQSKN